METKEKTNYSNSNVDANEYNSKLTVLVKANKLFNTKFPVNNLETLIDQCTALIDNTGLESIYGAKNKDFLTYVYIKNSMTWDIQLASPEGEDDGYKVHLVTVTQDPKSGNPNFFGRDVLKVDAKGVILGNVVDNPSLEGKNDYYTIHFYVSKEGEDTIILPIDPKLQIRPKIN